MRLDAGKWTLDVANGGVKTPGGSVPDMISVATVSRAEAWAVSGSNSNSLLVFHRTNGAWARELTGESIFDSPPAPVSGGDGAGTINQFARGSAVAVAPSGVFVSGMMQPVDGTKVAGDTSAADRTRPFVIRERAGTYTSFCPPMYHVSSSGGVRSLPVCDKPFPFATGDLPALAAAGGRVFAGGHGLFSYSAGG